MSNGQLLKAAEQAGFNVLLTTDSNIRFQQNLTSRQIGIVVIAPNLWKVIRAKLSLIVTAGEAAKGGEVALVQL